MSKVRVEVLEKQGWECTGSYGIFNNPVYRDPETGETFVAEFCFVNDNGEAGEEACQSHGCGLCFGNYLGCRHSGEHEGRETAYFI